MILQRKSNFNRHPRVELSLPSPFFQQILINYFEEQLRRLQKNCRLIELLSTKILN